MLFLLALKVARPQQLESEIEKPFYICGNLICMLVPLRFSLSIPREYSRDVPQLFSMGKENYI